MGLNLNKYIEAATPHSIKSRSRRFIFASLMLMVLTMIWGMTFPATKSALETTNPMHFLALRFSFASLILLLITVIRRNHFNHLGFKELLNTWMRGIFIGLFLLLGFTLQVVGLRYTSASRSGFFTGLLVVMVPILAFIFGTSKVSRFSWLALLPAVSGIYLIADPGSGGLNRGDFLTIGCALIFALQMVVLESLSRGARETWHLTFAQVVTIALGAIAWSLVDRQPFSANLLTWSAVGYTAIFGSVIAVWLQTRYQPEVPAGHAAFIFTLEPVFASLFAWMFLGEIWSSKGLQGAALILFAMIISSLSLLKKSKTDLV